MLFLLAGIVMFSTFSVYKTLSKMTNLQTHYMNN